MVPGDAGAIDERIRYPAADARGFDAAKWLGKWLELPQPALGGRRAADLIDTPTGLDLVARLLGSTASGSFQ